MPGRSTLLGTSRFRHGSPPKVPNALPNCLIKEGPATIRPHNDEENVSSCGSRRHGSRGRRVFALPGKRHFPLSEIRLLASARSLGKKLAFNGKKVTVEELTEDSFKNLDIAFFSAGGSISKKFAPIAAEAGVLVIDNSSAFRMEPSVPLVIPESIRKPLPDTRASSPTRTALRSLRSPRFGLFIRRTEYIGSLPRLIRRPQEPGRPPWRSWSNRLARIWRTALIRIQCCRTLTPSTSSAITRRSITRAATTKRRSRWPMKRRRFLAIPRFA